MASTYSFIGSVVGHELDTLYSGAAVAIGVSALGLACSIALKCAKEPMVPDSKLSLRNFGELVAAFVLQLGDMVMGKHNRKYLPFVGTLFFYIIFLNLSGLIPGFHGPTGGAWPNSLLFNVGIVIVVFICYHIWGIRDVGIVNYCKHFFGGPDLAKWPLIIIGAFVAVVEIISHLARCVSLSFRLYGNMTGDHAILNVFTELTGLVVPVIFYGMGTFVSFIQAFVFTLLTMVYIRFATEHEHEEGEEGH